jgi:hypothetical protein
MKDGSEVDIRVLRKANIELAQELEVIKQLSRKMLKSWLIGNGSDFISNIDNLRQMVNYDD